MEAKLWGFKGGRELNRARARARNHGLHIKFMVAPTRARALARFPFLKPRKAAPLKYLVSGKNSEMLLKLLFGACAETQQR